MGVAFIMDHFDDSELERLLDVARDEPEISPERIRAITEGARDRIAASSIGMATPGEPPPAPQPAASGFAGAVTPARAAIWSVAVFAAGLATGVALTRWLGDESVEPADATELPVERGDAPLSVEEVEALVPDGSPEDGVDARDVAAVGTPAAPAETGGGESVSMEVAAPRGARSSGSVEHDASGTTTLASERLVIEAAQSALGRHNARVALQRTQEHAARFPAGRFVAEREAIAIRALFMLGRDAEAIRRAEAFDRRWPGSLLRGTFGAALRAAQEASESVDE